MVAIKTLMASLWTREIVVRKAETLSERLGFRDNDMGRIIRAIWEDSPATGKPSQSWWHPG
jgi:hypothetical protein